ncbi:unnamed protein product [Clonostachys chloroleuca]|uniref:SRPBCC domain-containing protein n=1 Tax=Clonostachys chloroleuca TaxID=1926264 RepID=A0AA35Q0Z5_9HYPO|nr:unnamed protein product [Clonostachys chloroleuca]
MGKVEVYAQIDIAASPGAVRNVFLDFARYNEWQKGWNITLMDSSKTQSDLEVGDRLRVAMHGMVFRPYVEENSPERFTWTGSIPILLTGQHSFLFTPSKEIAGGTTFIQTENFGGALAVMYSPFAKKQPAPSPNWEAFNAALKQEAEKRYPLV